MELINLQAVGTHFKKENIFLATLFPNEEYSLNVLKDTKSYKDMSESMLKECIKLGIIQCNEVDIFYKDETGYTRYLGEGPETYAGDNSDGRGYIKNVVSVWDYYSEGELFEAMIDGKFMAIVNDGDGLDRYNDDYNKAFERNIE